MIRGRRVFPLLIAAWAAPLLLCGQTGDEPVFKISVVSKTTKAINYKVLGGATKVDFAGTAIMPAAKGRATVESKQNRIRVDAAVELLDPPTRFGAEYLTYVLWSVSPEGRATNLGEFLLDKGKGKISVTTELQVFALIITAEPYFAVRQPSDLVVLENELRKETQGTVFLVDTKFELLQRGQYARLANPLALTVDTRTFPLELYEARNAIYIAQSFGADRYAADTFPRAKASLQMAEDAAKLKQPDRSQVATAARQAVQFAEDARELAVKRQQDEALAMEREAAAKREAEERLKAEQARAAAEREAREKTQAVAARQAEEERRATAEKQKAEADRQRMEAELAAAREAAKRAEAEAAKAQAEAAKAQAEAARIQAEAGKAQAEAGKAQAEAEQEKARKLVEQAEREKAELRARLLQQFNQVLETRDSERGLVVNMGDVLFDTGKFTIRQEAREKLARLSGIVLAYPGLSLVAEGHTDNVGGEALNQTLSEQRAGSVRDYLVSQGLPEANVTSVGKGFSMPVASNDTAAGRQKNRRVEIIVSGEVIGTRIGAR